MYFYRPPQSKTHIIHVCKRELTFDMKSKQVSAGLGKRFNVLLRLLNLVDQ